MARVHPARPDPESPSGELRVRDALARLPDPWRVFHRVAWQSVRDGRQGDGEADFVLLHPRVGLIVLEVKGGRISVEDGQWFSTDGQGERWQVRNPLAQATSSKHALATYLRGAVRGLPFLPAGHGVVLPDIGEPPRLGPAAPREIVLGRHDLREIEAAIRRLADHLQLHGGLSEEQTGAITELLAPTVEARPVLRDRVSDVAAELLQLTDEQVGVLDSLRRNRRVIVYGAAGTGKTILAVERTRRLAAEGFRVLLTCFNQPLGDWLHREFSGDPRVTARHFHGLCRWLAGRGDLEVPENPPSEWYTDAAPDLLLDAARKCEFQIDAVVVDEGQDFAPEWWVALQSLMSDGDAGPFHVFADTRQNIYRDGWAPPFEGLSYDLYRNCRSTRQIARAVSAVYGETQEARGAEGPDPEFVTAAGGERIEAALRRVLGRLLGEEKLEPAQVIVLGDRLSIVAPLRGRDLGCCRLEDAHRLDTGGAERGRVVAVDTIHRFKGLERDVVVLVLSKVGTARDRALAYVGMSRARAHLVVIGPETVWRGLNWGVTAKP
jgi:hypothetical protein